MTSRVRRAGRSPLALAWLLAAVGLAGCGSDWPTVPQEGGSAAGPPSIVAAEVVDSGVQVTYRVPGADGGGWPVLKISVRAPSSLVPPTSQDVRPGEEEGTVVIPIEVQPGSDLTIFGSAFYEDGKRVDLPEKQVRSQASVAAGAEDGEPGEPRENAFEGAWQAIGRVTFVPAGVNSNQPPGTVLERPWSFREVCRATCEVVFTRGTLYGPSVTRLVKQGRFFIAEFPPVGVPCAYPPDYPYPRSIEGESHDRYKLWWSDDRTELHAIEHRQQTGCYPSDPDPPDVTRWYATRVS